MITVPAVLRTLQAGLVDEEQLRRFAGARPGRGGRSAAVLVLLAVRDDGPTVIIVERSATLRHHAGQLAFPGGSAEPQDADLAATAVREAVEEVGLDPAGAEVLGVVPAVHVAVTGFDVTAVVAWWRDPHPLTALDPVEVAAAYEIPVATLVDPDTRVQVQHPSGYSGPGFVVEHGPSTGSGGPSTGSGHGAPGSGSGELLIWGLTAHLLDGLLELAGWARPWDRSRTAEIPARYLTDRRPTGGTADAH